MTQPLPLHDVLLDRVRSDRAVPDLQAYFCAPDDAEAPAGVFTGRLFERIAGKGDADEVADVMTAGDLLAVEALSVNVPPEVAFRLLHGSLGKRIAGCLAEVPRHLALGEGAARDHLADDAAASRAWQLLVAADGIGWVTAGKLLARKRPALIPIYDDVVRCVIGSPQHFWLDLDAAFRFEDGVLMRELDRVRSEASLADDITRLRVLDVVLWMSHREDHGAGACEAHPGGPSPRLG